MACTLPSLVLSLTSGEAAPPAGVGGFIRVRQQRRSRGDAIGRGHGVAAALQRVGSCHRAVRLGDLLGGHQRLLLVTLVLQEALPLFTIAGVLSSSSFWRRQVPVHKDHHQLDETPQQAHEELRRGGEGATAKRYGGTGQSKVDNVVSVHVNYPGCSELVDHKRAKTKITQS